MPGDEAVPAKKKTTKKPKGRIDQGEPGDVLITIGKAGKLKASRGVQHWNLDGSMPTTEGDRFAIARLTPADLYNLGWIRRK